MAEILYFDEHAGASNEVLRAVAKTKNILRNEDIRGLVVGFILPSGNVGTLIAGTDGNYHMVNSAISILRTRFDREFTK